MATPTTTTAILPTPTGGLGGWIKHHDEHWLFVLIYLGLAVGLSIFVSLFWLVVVVAFHLVLELVRQAFYRETYPSVILHALWEIKMDVGLVLLALTLVLYIEVVLGILGLQSAARAAAASRAVHAGSRAGSRAGATASAAEQWVRGILLAFDEMARVTYATIMMKKGNGEEEAAEARAEGEVGMGDAAGDPAEGAYAQALAEPAAESVEGTPELEEASPEAVEAGSEPVEGMPAPLEALPQPAWQGSWGMADHIGLAMVAAGLVLIVAAPYLTIHDWGSALVTLLEELRPLPG